MSTKIPYIDVLWSPITGCSGKGCATRETCWARGMVNRFAAIHGFRDIEETIEFPFHLPNFHPDRLDQPLHWRKPRRVGVCFMGDWMDDQVLPNWEYEIMEVIKSCPQHQFFTLTKQSQNFALRRYIFYDLPNVWHGVSCCTQADLDRMVHDLLRIPGKKWLSLEPMLGPVNLKRLFLSKNHPDWTRPFIKDLNWLIIGSHSNPKRYPCKLEWIQSVVEQCRAAGVPWYVKQIPLAGKCNRNPEEWPEWARVREIC